MLKRREEYTQFGSRDLSWLITLNALAVWNLGQNLSCRADLKKYLAEKEPESGDRRRGLRRLGRC
jgi:hypothetical protein